MATSSMDVDDWLRKQFANAEPDLLREMVSTFAHALMAAEGRPAVWRGIWRAQRRSREPPQRAAHPRFRHAGRLDRARDPEAPPRQLLPRLAADAAPARRAGAHRGGGRVLRQGRLHAPCGWSGQDVGGSRGSPSRRSPSSPSRWTLRWKRFARVRCSPARTPRCGWTPARRSAAKSGGSSTSLRCARPASTPTATEKFWM